MTDRFAAWTRQHTPCCLLPPCSSVLLLADGVAAAARSGARRKAGPVQLWADADVGRERDG